MILINAPIHPHNFHLEILQSTGLVGYVSFLILIYYLFMTVIKNNSLGTSDKLLIIIILLIIFNPITTSGSIFFQAFQINFGLSRQLLFF